MTSCSKRCPRGRRWPAVIAAPDRAGWVVLASFRPEIPPAQAARRRSVKIVVDCSGSMAGDSIAQARAALERILDGLRGGDLLDIVAFGSHARPLFGHETPVSETSLAAARSFVRAIDADMGGTEIAAALQAAWTIGGGEDIPRDLLHRRRGGQAAGAERAAYRSGGCGR